MKRFLKATKPQQLRRLALASLLCVSAGLQASHSQPIAVEAKDLGSVNKQDHATTTAAHDAGYIINFNNVSIVEYLRFISKIGGTNFVFNPEELNFRVTIVSEEPATVENIMSILLQILQVHGLKLQEEGKQVLIYKDASLGQLATVVPEGAEKSPFPPIVTRIFHIENGTASNAAGVIAPLLSPHAAISSSDATGHLIVTDVAGNIEKIDTLIHSLDDMEVAYFEVKYSYADAIVSLAKQILAPIGGAEITLVPQSATDTVFVVATPYMVRRALGVLKMLDVPGGQTERAGQISPTTGEQFPSEISESVPTRATTGPLVSSTGGPPTTRPSRQGLKSDGDSTTFAIYKLQYHLGDEIRDALQNIAGSLRSAETEASDLQRAISTVQWIKATNSLVISGTQASINRVNALIEDLDVPLKEVYIEALVVRTTLANTMEIGVEWGSKSTYNAGGTNPDVIQSALGGTKGSPTGNPSSLNARLNPLQVPTPIPLSEGLDFGVVGRFVSFNGKLFTSLGMIVDALQTCDDTTILLNPKLLTLDNHEARIFVGSNIAFQASTITQPGAETVVGEIVYRDIGTDFTIKPILSNSDMVTLYLRQEISANQASNQVGQLNATLDPTLKSILKTYVTVPSGYFLVIAGQINDTRIKRHNGLPCLGGLPIIGTCFSTKVLEDSRDNLIIFLRPHIINTKAEMVHLTECEKLRTDRANKIGSYKMDLETLLDVLNIKPEDSKACPSPICCDCGFPCWPQNANTNRPTCYHDCDDIMDRYFQYPCECP